MPKDTRETQDADGPAGAAAPAPPDASAAQTPEGEAGPAVTLQQTATSGAGLRVLGAAVTLPWTILYGITGTWAATRGATAFSGGLKQLDAGYTRMVTPSELMFVGALMLAGFGVMLACALLLLFGSRSAMLWLPLLLIAAGFTAGSVWAAVSGGLHPILWFLLFFGLAYVTVVALVRVVHVTRAARRGRIA
ncbi:MAG: hypothetical protein IH629_06040 [Thermoleophilia bacterium]|nr:hypothetical protein [Thermoleophilia bacterium]